MNVRSRCRLLFCLIYLFTVLAHADAGEILIDVYTSAPSFHVVLNANPSTGYQWTVLKYDQNLFYYNGGQYKASKTGAIGGGGQVTFTFLLNSDQDYPASTIILFKYARPWDPHSAVMQKVRVNFLKAHYSNHEDDEGWTPFYDPLHESASFFSQW
jgi:inhibitor of cysteine peptidase